MLPGLNADTERQRRRLGWRIYGAEWLLAGATLAALVLGHGVRQWESALATELGVVSLGAMIGLSGGLAWRLTLSRDWRGFLQARALLIAVHLAWLLLIPVVALIGLPVAVSGASAMENVLILSEAAFWLRVLASSIHLVRYVAAARSNPTFVFVGSFALLIAGGSLLLMLPVCRVQPAGAVREVGAPPLVALFTATSASCVTGLTVVDTGAYWTRTGQGVILCLIQIGGLGVMTFGAFFALGQRRGFLVRERVFMGKLLDADDAQALRRTIVAILVFTLASEVIGAAFLSTLSRDQAWEEQAWSGLFHSVSAFCNAGFSLLPKNLEGLEQRWQVVGVIAPLIILGGLGFDALRNAAQVTLGAIRRRWAFFGGHSSAPARLSATTRLVLTTTVALLVAGVASFFILEAGGLLRGQSLSQRLAHSWFQSVTFRTAGFNTVDFSRAQPTTKLVAIGMMFVGASPGSTGGGIKTVVFALMVLATASTVRGRDRLEIAGRTIPDEFIRRGAAVVAMALAVLLTSTLLVVMFEHRPELFLDHLFETTSAQGTVGLSSVGTANLQPASQLVLVATMFLGRVGPLTILVALARRRAEPKYIYPSERVMLG